ncbi:hypothetical protein P154DRAFT_177159 [Amniculicola lignicola CBS 123094]|uniref:Uncharacterized protein n=1 Tax=Amniculicola lignicola CBS 123094 TaxID=1392246 RepID=A0A6A5X2B0_9PLEO|nr:hypothetical protein P154DRAFT_177159 [Amniculicola lignicola CBS 123094]
MNLQHPACILCSVFAFSCAPVPRGDSTSSIIPDHAEAALKPRSPTRSPIHPNIASLKNQPRPIRGVHKQYIHDAAISSPLPHSSVQSCDSSNPYIPPSSCIPQTQHDNRIQSHASKPSYPQQTNNQALTNTPFVALLRLTSPTPQPAPMQQPIHKSPSIAPQPSHQTWLVACISTSTRA